MHGLKAAENAAAFNYAFISFLGSTFLLNHSTVSVSVCSIGLVVYPNSLLAFSWLKSELEVSVYNEYDVKSGGFFFIL